MVIRIKHWVITHRDILSLVIRYGVLLMLIGIYLIFYREKKAQFASEPASSLFEYDSLTIKIIIISVLLFIAFIVLRSINYKIESQIEKDQSKKTE
jgi:heme/copper-type cytochrome/quinol oxidase subunit 2